MTRQQRIVKDLRVNKHTYIMLIPVLAFLIIFSYVPMYGIIIAFKDYVSTKGILGSDWVGFQHFTDFFKSIFFGRLMKNTLVLSFCDLIFAFPASIIFALLLNEVHHRRYKKVVQTIAYMPNFISMVVIAGMVITFTSTTGPISSIIQTFGGQPVDLLSEPGYFPAIYVISGIWQGVGFGSIIYLASISNIDQELYEAAVMDGANRFKQALHVTLPCLAPTITILLILRLGGMMSVGYEKIILLSNGNNMETADVISTYVYRAGILLSNYSYSTAIGLFNNVINFVLLLAANRVSKKITDISLW